MPLTPMQIQAPPGPFVDADWLEAHLDQPGLRVLDVRGRHPSSPKPHAKRAEYATSHIPGAVLADWEHDLIDGDDPVPYQVAGPRDFARHAERLGAGDGDLVVTYDDYYGIFAARVAWAFRLYGAEARVLDGGWPTWLEEGRPVTDATPQHPQASFTPRPRPRLRLTLAELEAARARGATVIDARPRHLYLGEEGAPGTGHIPGALCLPYPELVDGSAGIVAAPAAIRRLLRGAGLDPERPPAELVVSCGSGVSATLALIALESVGIHGAGVYDGAFNEWSADPARPIAYGPAG
jgi:thiosulfate/3-mercaptopyruvate sulfurtransferase